MKHETRMVHLSAATPYASHVLGQKSPLLSCAHPYHVHCHTAWSCSNQNLEWLKMLVKPSHLEFWGNTSGVGPAAEMQIHLQCDV